MENMSVTKYEFVDYSHDSYCMFAYYCDENATTAQTRDPDHGGKLRKVMFLVEDEE